MGGLTMTQIFIVESCSEMKQFNTRDGRTLSSQEVKLREVTGNSAYSTRWIVDNLSGTDVTGHIAKPIACTIENYINSKDGREYNNLLIREVQKL